MIGPSHRESGGCCRKGQCRRLTLCKNIQVFFRHLQKSSEVRLNLAKQSLTQILYRVFVFNREEGILFWLFFFGELHDIHC